MSSRLPRFSADLIKEIDKNEGPLRFSTKATIAEIMFKAGRRAVIDELLTKLDESQDEFQVLKG